jgi:hypothetical protein
VTALLCGQVPIGLECAAAWVCPPCHCCCCRRHVTAAAMSLLLLLLLPWCRASPWTCSRSTVLHTGRMLGAWPTPQQCFSRRLWPSEHYAGWLCGMYP